MSDFYAILEVSRDASAEEIRKQYKNLALQWHPDKNPRKIDEASRKFREISAAYEVLGDPEKRRVYDQQLKEDADRLIDEFDFRDPTDLFEETFGARSPFSDHFFMNYSQSRTRSTEMSNFFDFFHKNIFSGSNDSLPDLDFRSLRQSRQDNEFVSFL